MVQVITYGGDKKHYQGALVEQYSFHDIRSLDEYSINIIDLNDERIWYNDKDNKTSLNCIADLKSISSMIVNSRTAKIIILLPQNLKYHYYLATHEYGKGRTYKKEELKNMLGELTGYILKQLYSPMVHIPLEFENTKTRVRNNEYSASFYFFNESDAKMKSNMSEKATVLIRGNVILSSLELKDYNSLHDFLDELSLLDKREEEPEWLSGVKMFDDIVQELIIADKEKEINDAKQVIDQANMILEKNKRMKSVLYTNGDELVEVVFEILEELLGCNLSEFVDLMKEDFLFTVGGITFIGEIKGVNSNVKNPNITQLEVHYQDYCEEHDDIPEDKIKALLIMNHQKSKPIEEREPIMERQINLAKRNGSLIIDTYTLLQILEKYRKGDMSREEILSRFIETTGVLSI